MDLSRKLVAIFFVCYFFLGLALVSDYGIGMDEINERSLGWRTIDFVLHRDLNVITGSNQFHGPVVVVLLNCLERLFRVSNNPAQIFRMRHITVFLLFFAALIFFYRLLRYHFKKRWLALVGCLFLILSPRIFAGSFYDHKDIPFLSLFIISIYTLVRFFDKPGLKRVIAHAFVCGLLVDQRIAGLIVPCLTVMYFMIDRLCNHTVSRLSVWIRTLASYLFLQIFFIYIFWPRIWLNPVGDVLHTLRLMVKFPANTPVLYMGKIIISTNIPWHYVMVWVAITTPILYLLFFLVGNVRALRNILATRKKYFLVGVDRLDSIALIWFWVPVLLAIVFHSNLYDSYRHLFFIYPALIFLAVLGLHALWESLDSRSERARRMLRLIIVGVIFVQLAGVALFMWRNHPYQNVYFNRLAGPDMKSIKENFEMDYHGLSYRKGFEYLAKTVSGPIDIHVSNSTYLISASFLAPEDRSRFRICSSGPLYYMTNYRCLSTRPHSLYREKQFEQSGEEIYSIKVDGAKIFGIYYMPGRASLKTCFSLDRIFSAEGL